MKSKPITEGCEVRVRMSMSDKLGDTPYKVTKLLPGCGCMIKEISDQHDYAEQRFDTSLLVAV